MSHFSSLSSNLFKGTLFSYSWGFPLFLRSMGSSDRNQRSFAEKDNFLFHSRKRLFCDHVGKYIQNLLLLTSLIPYPTSYSLLGTTDCCVPVLFHANEPPHMLLPWCCLSFLTIEANSSVSFEIGMIIEFITQIGTQVKRKANQTGSVKIGVNRDVWSSYLRAI